MKDNAIPFIHSIGLCNCVVFCGTDLTSIDKFLETFLESIHYAHHYYCRLHTNLYEVNAATLSISGSPNGSEVRIERIVQ